MFRLALKVALAAGALWAVWTFVPVRGRTLAERWRAAPDAAAFVERGWDEATHALAGRSSAKPQAQARQKPAPAQRPTEGHTEADRQAVERLLSDRLDGRP
jgi:hypothetical protein